MARNPKGLTLSQQEVSQTFDLKELFGSDVSDRPDVAVRFGQAALDVILKRTADNRDINGNGLKEYSPEYIESDEFKAFGKSKNNVNMELSGRMMSDMDILSMVGNKLKIGFRDDTQTAKAYNHNVGDTVKKRSFFGVRTTEMKTKIKELKKSLQRTQSKAASEFNESVLDILGDLRTSDPNANSRESELSDIFMEALFASNS